MQLLDLPYNQFQYQKIFPVNINKSPNEIAGQFNITDDSCVTYKSARIIIYMCAGISHGF